jgi:hypothetical protein
MWIEDVDDLYDDPPVVDQNVIPYNLPTQTCYMSDLHMQKLHERLVFYPKCGTWQSVFKVFQLLVVHFVLRLKETV